MPTNGEKRPRWLMRCKCGARVKASADRPGRPGFRAQVVPAPETPATFAKKSQRFQRASERSKTNPRQEDERQAVASSVPAWGVQFQRRDRGITLARLGRSQCVTSVRPQEWGSAAGL